jgi:outer membrane receptor protein involved in Fe transport
MLIRAGTLSIYRLKGAAGRGALALAMATLPAAAGFAQSAADNSTVAEPITGRNAGAQAANSANEAGEIVVTGSRIARRDYVSNTPITTVRDEVLQNTGSFALESKLLQLPQFAGAANSQYSTGYFNSGAATLNLRNLGDNRNLVLLDGRRLQPSQSNLAIDINTIPSVLIDNVEVITGGASAVYGADAVSGVVNFKLKNNFSGAQIDAYSGIAERGYNRVIDLSAVLGGNFADDRGNAVLSMTYSNRGPVDNVDIPFLRRGFEVGALPASSSFLSGGYYKPVANAPSQAAINSYFARFGAPAGAVTNGTTLGFNNDGTSLFNVTGANIYDYTSPLFPRFVIDTYTTPGRAAVKQNFTAETLASLPLERWSAFASTHYDVTDAITLYGQALYTHYDSVTKGGAPVADNFWQVDIPRDAAHPVPADFATLLAARPNPNAPWTLGKLLSFMGLGTVAHTNDVWQFVGGARGKFGASGITWDIYASHGDTQLVDRGTSGFASRARYTELMLAPNYGRNYSNGSARCTSGISPFGELNGEGAGTTGNAALGTVSADCIDYLNPYYTSRTKLKQDVVEGTVQGRAFDLPGGEVRFALGATYRKNSFSFNPDKAFAPDVNYASDIIGQFGILPVSGSNSVKEVYGELLVPILRDIPFFERLEVDLAYRYSDYQRSGGEHAYKADVNWQLFQPIRLRGGYQRAVRAPNVVEQFGPPTLVFDAATDACQSNLPTAYGNIPSNANRAKVQALCRTLMGGGAPQITDAAGDPYGLNTYLGGGSASLNSYPAGNPNVRPEKADTITAGAVFAPTWALPLDSRVSLSVDYYDIKIDGAIGYVNAQLSYQLCFNANGTSNPTYDPANVYCQSIQRSTTPGTGYPTGVFSTYLNQGGIRTRGVDIQGDLKSDIGPGRFNLNVIANYLDSFKRRVAPGSPSIDYAGFAGGYYKWKIFTNASYQVGPVLAGVRWRHLTGATPQDYLVSPCAATAVRCFANTARYDAFDLFTNIRANDTISIRAGVDNFLDTQPPVVRGIPGNTDPQNYDIIGRRFYVAVSTKF